MKNIRTVREAVHSSKSARSASALPMGTTVSLRERDNTRARLWRNPPKKRAMAGLNPDDRVKASHFLQPETVEA